MTVRCSFFLVILLIGGAVSAQSNKDLAIKKGQEAISLMDGGQIEASIKLLEESMKLDPENLDFPYEMGYAYYLAKDYQKTINILKELAKKKAANDLVFQLLGNSYDMIGKRDKAIDTYQSGLKRIPKSGRLHLELGGMYLVTEEFDKAINYYENGIEAEPGYPSNYYRLAKMFLNSDEEIWGMIYGELFMNLERNTARTAEISKTLYDTYKSQIQFTSDTSFNVSFSKNVIEFTAKKFELTYGIAVYEPTLMISMLSEKTIDLSSLDRIRTAFVMNYFQNKRDKQYPNVLFDYHNSILKEGHMEAYNHWILMKGDEEGFVRWKDANADKWDSFVAWFNPNPIRVDNKNKFLRTDY